MVHKGAILDACRARVRAGRCRSYERRFRTVRRIRAIFFAPPQGTRREETADPHRGAHRHHYHGASIVKETRAFDKDRSPDSGTERRRSS